MSKSAYLTALDLLAQRPYATRTLRQKLVRKELPADEVDEAIERLTAAALLDDARYAMLFARSKMTSTGASRRRIEAELSRKGIPAAVSRPAIEDTIAEEEIDTEAVLEKVARKKIASMGDLEPLVLRRRLFSFLARRGYDLDEIRRVTSKILP